MSAPVPAHPVELVVHMGTGKTGTSSIQELLHANGDRLMGRGILYPQTPGPRRHLGLTLFMQDADPHDVPTGRREFYRSQEAFEQRLVSEVDRAGVSRVVLSDEAVYASSAKALRRLRDLTDRLAHHVRLVVYLRRQDEHLVSRYQQVVKVGETRRLAERLCLDLSDTYDYYARLRKHQRILEPDELVVRRFERAAFVDGSLYQDFLHAARLDVLEGDLEPIEVQNESLDAESVEFLRLLNLLRVERPDLAPAFAGNRRLVPSLEARSSGPVLTLSDQELDAFMAQWEESNRQVARELAEDAGDPLFHSPRTVRVATTDQRLDPARLGHFVGVTGLPESIYQPLRALAEREARGTAG